MTDRANRLSLALIGLVLLVAGVLSVLLGAAVFGTKRSKSPIFDSTLIRWFNEGGWLTYLVIVAIGLVVLIIGLRLVLSQFRRNDGRSHAPDFTLAPVKGTRGETKLRAPALSNSLEQDLKQIPDVHGATVNLFGHYPRLELRAILDLGDDADLEQLPIRVDEAVGRLQTTTGVRPDPMLFTVRFKQAERQRQLH